MEKRSFRQFDQDLSWSTRIYTLLVAALIASAILWNAWENNWVVPMLVSLGIILLVENFLFIVYRHPVGWRLIKWAILLIALLFLLIG